MLFFTNSRYHVAAENTPYPAEYKKEHEMTFPLKSDMFPHITSTQQPIPLSAGDVLFYEGEGSEDAYVIVSGLIEITRRVGNAEVLLAVCTPGEIIGEMALIEHMPRSATARALKPSEVRVLPREDFELLLQGSDPAIRQLLTRMAHLIRTLTDSTVRQTLGLP